MARGVLEREKEWALLDLYDSNNNNNWSGGRKKIDWADGDPEDHYWELNRLPEIIIQIDKDKEEMRAAAALREEEQRPERNRSRWALKAQDLEKKEKENEKEKEKEKPKEKEKEEEKETSVERKFRLKPERSIGHQQLRDQINRLMTAPSPPIWRRTSWTTSASRVR
jgi:flagellar biosynthesis GTPase FlhF